MNRLLESAIFVPSPPQRSGEAKGEKVLALMGKAAGVRLPKSKHSQPA